MATTIDKQVDASARDSMQDAETTVVVINGSEMQFRSGSGDNRIGFFKFEDVDIPQGSTIDVCYIEFYVSQTGNMDFDFYCEYAAGPADSQANNNDITDRTWTTSFHHWSEAWGSTGVWEGADQSLADELQEVVDDFTTTEVAVICEPHTYNAGEQVRCRTWDFNSTLAAKLHVEWSAGGAAREKVLSDTLSMSDNIQKEVEKPLSDGALAITDTISKEPGLIKSEAALAIADAISKEPGLNKSDNIMFADSFARISAFIRPFSDTINITDSLAKVVGFIKADSLAIADTISKAPGIPMADVLAMTDGISKGVSIPQADTFALADAIVKEYGIALGDALVLADSYTRNIYLSFSDTLVVADSLSTSIGYYLYLSDNLAISDSLLMGLGLFITLADTLDISDSYYFHWGQPTRLPIGRMSASRIASGRLIASRLGKRRLSP